MNFTIIGAGNMGRGIATRLVNGGNQVTIIDRDDSEASALAQALRTEVKSGGTVGSALAGSPINSEVVILAVNYPSTPAIIEQYGQQLSGKIVVDISNPLNATYDDLATSPGPSRPAGCARSTWARCVTPGSWKGWACSTSPCKEHLAQTTPARSRSCRDFNPGPCTGCGGPIPPAPFP